MTGEVGFAPPSVSGGTSAETISIWFVATHCAGGSPTPTSVIGSIAFPYKPNTCPLLPPNFTTKGILNLTYNYPGGPNPMVEPSVAMPTTVSPGAIWWLKSPKVVGSYPSNSLKIPLHPILFAGQTCNSPGVTDMYIADTGGPALTGI